MSTSAVTADVAAIAAVRLTIPAAVFVMFAVTVDVPATVAVRVCHCTAAAVTVDVAVIAA